MVTVLTRTIGPSGRDYASFTLAEADVTNIGTSADLVANDEAIVFEADAGTYIESVNVTSSLTTDATRQVTYRPAAGSGHGGDINAGVRVVFNTAGNGCFRITDDFTHIVGLVCTTDTGAVGNRGLISANADGVLVDGCILNVEHSTPWCLWSNGGGATAVNVYQNNLLRNANQRPISLYSIAAPTSHKFINNTIEGYGDRAIFYQVLGNSMTVDAVNNFIFNVNNWAQGNSSGGATFTTTGTNNVIDVVGSNMGAGVAILECTATTSFSTPLGAGDFAVYMGSNGSLANVTGNDAWGVGVGPASNSDVPTTDINGVTRSGTSCNPGAFEADGFVAPTVITKTIAASGADYATFTLAEAAVTSIGSGTDLTFYNEAIVFEADAGTYTESVTFSSSLTTDATRQVTYKPASGAEHGGVAGSGVHIEGSIAATTTDDHLSLKGLSLKSTVSSGLSQTKGIGLTVADCIVETSASGNAAVYSRSASGHASLEMVNSVTIPTTGPAMWLRKTASLSYSASVYNCTTKDQIIKVQSDGGAAGIDITNCLSLGSDSYLNTSSGGGSITLSGSNNFGGSSFPFPAALQGSPYPITASTAYDPGAGDFALYVGKNGALLDSPNNDVIDQGVGPSANSDVPTTDILGKTRCGATANPGAFEQPQATATITKTIGPSGRDYTTFTLAEADVTNIGGSADLVNENERIVFEADAGTYSETVTFNSTITTDATRNVNYKPAAGSEHGGDPNAGVIISGGAQVIYDRYTVMEGLTAKAATAQPWYVLGDGVSINACIGVAQSGASKVFLVGGCDGASLRNCVAIGSPYISIDLYVGSSRSVSVYNCTIADDPSGPGGTSYVFRIANDTVVDVTNCISLRQVANEWTIGTGCTVTGSNNFGRATGASGFPAALQGSPYPITATTSFSTPLGSGDYAVYMGATGALARVTGNDVWQQGVGPASNSDVPTTDINGVTRSGTSCNPGAFEADGFVAPTVLTRTIGSGKDYSTFTLAEAAVTSIGSGTDLTLYNEAIVFEADAGTYSEKFDISSTLTTDPTRNVTFRPASGSEHQGVAGQGPHIVYSGHTIRLFDEHVALDGLSVYSPSGNTVAIMSGAYGASIRRCLIDAGAGAFFAAALTDSQTASGTASVIENSVIFSDGTAWAVRLRNKVNAQVRNCTLDSNVGMVVESSTYDGDLEVVNNLSLGPSYNKTGTGVVTLTGSNNFGESGGLPWPAAVAGSPNPITATTDTDPGAGDWAIYDAATRALVNVPANDVLNKGVGPIIKSEVPTTDIVGATRANFYADPGAFQASAVLPQQEATQAFGAAVSHQRAVTRQRATVSAGATAHVTSGGLR